jgi:hypothetical protein
MLIEKLIKQGLGNFVNIMDFVLENAQKKAIIFISLV